MSRFDVYKIDAGHPLPFWLKPFRFRGSHFLEGLGNQSRGHASLRRGPFGGNLVPQSGWYRRRHKAGAEPDRSSGGGAGVGSRR